MKNLIWAVSGLILLLILVFSFTSIDGSKNDIIDLIPPPDASTIIELMTDESSKSSNDSPFHILNASEIEGKKVRISTEKGDIVIELFSDSPLASSNFIELIKNNFYNGLIFHRRDEGFVIQGGDPNGDGTGGPGYSFDDEKVDRNYLKGTVAMANSGPNTNGSQFFIMLDDAPQLPKQYTIFGNVLEGIEVVDSIEIGDKMLKLTIE